MEFFEPIFAALESAGARYVAVGGIATILHGYIRLTRDVDLVIDLEPTQARRTLEALEAFGFVPVAPVRAMEFADPVARAAWIRDKHMVVFSLRHDRNHISVDLFVEYPMDFEALWAHSRLVTVGQTPIRIASLDDLIAIKRAASRPRDLLDVEQLERLRRLRQSSGRGELSDQ